MTDTAARLAAAGLRVKPLEWEYTVLTWTQRSIDAPSVEKPSAEIWKAPSILSRGGYEIMRLVDDRLPNVDDEQFRLRLGHEELTFPTLDAAKSAAYADKAARILAELTGDSHD